MNWSQFKTVLWLRWRLTWNQARRGGALGAAITAFLILVGIVGAVGAAVFGFILGWNFPRFSPITVMLIGDGIAAGLIFLWMIGFMVEIQRAEMMSIERLLSLPVKLKQVFFLNYLASLVTPSLIALVPFLLGISLAWGMREPRHGLLFLALGLSLVLVVTAVTYMVRGWLAALMANKRRRRAVVVGLTMFGVLAGQVPNLLFNNPYVRGRIEAQERQRKKLIADGKITVEKSNEELSAQVRLWHKAIPPLWIGYGAGSLREGREAPALVVTAAVTALGLWVLGRSYRSTMQVYLAAPKAGKRKESREVKAVMPPTTGGWIEKSIPWVPEEVSVLTLGFVRSMWQAPEIKMVLLSPLITILAVMTMRFGPGRGFGGGGYTSFKVSGAIVLSMLSFVQLCYNSFGFERSGFRSLVLCPVRRSRILLAKNLSCVPLAMATGIIMLLLAKLFFGFGWVALLAGLFQLPAAFLLMCIVGNVCSITVPYRVNPGSLRGSKVSGKTGCARFIFQIVSTALLMTLFIPAGIESLARLGGVERFPVFLVASAGILTAYALAYAASLPALGQMLHEHELGILDVVTHELE